MKSNQVKVIFFFNRKGVIGNLYSFFFLIYANHYTFLQEKGRHTSLQLELELSFQPV